MLQNRGTPKYGLVQDFVWQVTHSGKKVTCRSFSHFSRIVNKVAITGDVLADFAHLWSDWS